MAPKDARSCPICHLIFSESSLKHHIRTCARHYLKRWRSCRHCHRPCDADDLREHVLSILGFSKNAHIDRTCASGVSFACAVYPALTV